MSRAEPLPPHADVPHEPNTWMVDTCERCRRQSIGQKKLLRTLIPDERLTKLYPDLKR